MKNENVIQAIDHAIKALEDLKATLSAEAEPAPAEPQITEPAAPSPEEPAAPSTAAPDIPGNAAEFGRHTPDEPVPAVAATGVEVCPKCGKPVVEGNLFCMSCGAKLEKNAPQATHSVAATFCINCGARLRSDDRFCMKCGTKVDSSF